MTHLVLTLYVADGIDEGEITDELNAEILCRLEEDDKKITGWMWITLDDKQDRMEICSK
jgi:hypothetical protein